MTRFHRPQPETSLQSATVLEIARRLDLTTRCVTTQAALERAEQEAARLAVEAKALRLAIRGELQRIRLAERAAARERELVEAAEVRP
jgi:hypothetical protein